MNDRSANTKLSYEQLNAVLEQYLPPEILPQAKASIQELFHENDWADLWKYRDRTTGLYNTSGILQILEEWNAQFLSEEKERILLLCIDVDRLETISLIYGNPERDSAIRTLGQILEDCLVSDAACGHLDSSEFVVIMHFCDSEENQVEDYLSNIQERIDNYNRVSAKDYSLHVSHSLFTLTPSAKANMKDTLSKALSQKRSMNDNAEGIVGGVQKQHIDPEEHRLVNKVLDKNLFRYAFQPIIDAKTGDIYAYEALMRTTDDVQLSPLTILKYAMMDGRLYDIERATFFNVLRQLSDMDGLGDRKVFINSISNCQLLPKDYKKLRSAFSGLFPNMVVEVTEQTEMDDERLTVILNRSKEDGFGLAVDDYGTGYSNTSSLLRYLPNCVKIDRLLISRIQEDPKKQHFVNNIITFAHDNGFLALAEGVETSAELKAVIQMGIDLIQGFYTAKPDFELLDALPEALKHEIISDTLCMHENIQRKVYIVDNDSELPLMQLALEQYTGIVVSQPELTLNGNPDYPAGMSIKIKDGCTCRLTIRNVYIESIEDMPCIDIGKNAHLTLVLDGNNVLEKTGIRVPDGSSCFIKGSGNLTIKAKGIYCYGIGNDLNSGVGTITYRSSGKMDISVDGNHCICMGGGIYREGEGIRLIKGTVQLTVAGVEAIGIGCREGSIPIEILECNTDIDFRVATGTAIGSWYGDQKIHLANLGLNIQGSGSHLCGIGSIEQTNGEIAIEEVMLRVQMTGQKVRLLGNESGKLKITVAKTHMKLTSEGSNVLGIGCFDNSAMLEIVESTMEIALLAAENIAVGALPENCYFRGGCRKILINNEAVQEDIFP